MQVFNKIGFHAGLGGNQRGLGQGGWMEKLDAAGIPFFLKSADDYEPLQEAAAFARVSGVTHTLVYRLSTAGQNDGFNYDEPDYSLDPAEAAVRHWQRTVAKLPAGFDKSLVWLEPVSEVDETRPDWLGHFAIRTAELALMDGYKVALFGWESGQPDPVAWETEGLSGFLNLCQQHQQKLAISLHEFSYKSEDIWFMRGVHVGGFQRLFDVCDRLGISRPTTLISEWGWTRQDVPNAQAAVNDILQAGELYALYPEVLGAALWYLGDGFHNIANRAEKLIEPVTEFTLSHRYPATAVLLTTRAAPRGAMVVEGVPTAVPEATNNGRYLADVTIPDNTRIPAGTAFKKTWRVENNGTLPWQAGYKLVHVGGEAMTGQLSHDLPAAAPGQRVEVSIDLVAPNRTGNFFSDWRFQDSQGNLFGDIIYLKIVVTAAAPQQGVNRSLFVADVTIPDDTKIEAGVKFTKTWRIRNTGTLAWGAGYRLGWVRGTPMGDNDSVGVPATAPGREIEVSVPMTAPAVAGTYWCDWRLKDDQGRFFGDLVFTRIIVPQAESSSGIPPLSQWDPRWAGERLGDSLSNKTIGEWGCLLVVYTMIANHFGENLTPPQLNLRIVRGPGFINNNWTPWNVLGNLFDDIVYGGRLETASTPDLLNRVNTAFGRGEMVALQVDNSPNTAYVPDDQHWVLVVGRDGDDYRVNDPLSGQEVSLRAVYGRPGRPLRDAVIAAAFYRSTRAPQPDDGVVPSTLRLQRGVNVNPDAPHSNPFEDDTLKGLDWVRFVFKVAAQLDPARRNLGAAFAQYDPIIRAYADKGVGSLLVLNQETVWGNSPWNGNNDWNGYANMLAETSRQVAAHYASYGARVAYEIWNEGDLPQNPASVFVPPDAFAIVLRRVAEAIRAESPQSKLIFGGLATGPGSAIAYVRQCKAALGGNLPVDAIGIHPYGRWATRAPFDWGSHFGTLADAFREFGQAFPGVPLWITEIGVAADTSIGPEHYAAVADYMKDVYQHVGERWTQQVPVLIWFAWSDLMRNAGIVDGNGNRKAHVYDVFKQVRNGELTTF